ncbi:MAG: DNA adenine methylase [Anaerolineae bacterium]|nr:DNA adenine methylase [Anaerolineae bacterium]
MPEVALAPVFPSTRYQGSKRKLVDWIWKNIEQLEFDTVLDAFGGTGAVAYRFKQAGKQVTYNDLLAFNTTIGLALIENSQVVVETDEIELLFQRDPAYDYDHFIAETFEGIYFTQAENIWLDMVIQNIDHRLTDPFKRALALFALYQACLVKRPYNLFHRKNLYIREANVKRSFGNKKTWDTPFERHFRKFVAEANTAVFDNARPNKALNQDVMALSPGYDLVYIDPPYMSRKGISVDYHAFYHFLEGLTRYKEWKNQIDYSTRHRCLLHRVSPWNDAEQIYGAFDALAEHFAGSILVISYRSDGIPPHDDLVKLLRRHRHTVTQAVLPQQYALSRNTHSKELLLVGHNRRGITEYRPLQTNHPKATQL